MFWERERISFSLPPSRLFSWWCSILENNTRLLLACRTFIYFVVLFHWYTLFTGIEGRRNFLFLFHAKYAWERKKARACIIITVKADFFLSSKFSWLEKCAFETLLFFCSFIFLPFLSFSFFLSVSPGCRVAGSTNLMSRYVWYKQSSQKQAKSMRIFKRFSSSFAFSFFITTQECFSPFAFFFFSFHSDFHKTQKKIYCYFSRFCLSTLKQIA